MIVAIAGACGGTPLVPRIVAQPSATLTGYENQSITIRVVAIGVSLQFQWYKGSGLISGATSASLVLQNLQQSDAASYYCVVSNANGTVTSTSCVLSVAQGVATIVTQPQNQSVFEGQPVSMSVSATSPAGTTLSYLWQMSTNSGASWSSTGVTSSEYTLSRAEMDANNARLRCRVTVVQSGVATLSDEATLSVTQVFLSEPQDIFGGIGDVVMFCELLQSRACKLQRSINYGAFADVNVHYDGLTDVVTAQNNPTQQTGTVIELRGNPATPYISSTRYRIKVDVGSGQFTFSRNANVDFLLRPNSVSVKTPCRKSGTAQFNQQIEDANGLLFVWSFGDAGGEVASGRSPFSDAITGEVPNNAYGTIRCDLNTAHTGVSRVSTAEVSVSDALQFTSQPSSPARYQLQTVNLAVTVESGDSASNLTYNWVASLADGATVLATGRTITPTAYHPGYQSPLENSATAEGDDWCANGSTLYCIVSDSKGNSLASNPVTLTINEIPPVVAPGYDATINRLYNQTYKLSDFGLTATSPNSPTGRQAVGVYETETSSSGAITTYGPYLLSDSPDGVVHNGGLDGQNHQIRVKFFNEFAELADINLQINFGAAPSIDGAGNLQGLFGGQNQFSSGQAIVPSGTFSLGTGTLPYNYAWSLTQGGSPAAADVFILPANSSEALPGNYLIIISMPGQYDLTLTATNSWGSSLDTFSFNVI